LPPANEPIAKPKRNTERTIAAETAVAPTKADINNMRMTSYRRAENPDMNMIKKTSQVLSDPMFFESSDMFNDRYQNPLITLTI
jgi:hypothetical protein